MKEYKIDLQIFPEENGTGTIEIPADHVKVIDPVTKKEMVVHKDVEKLLGHTISTTRNNVSKEVEGKYKSEIQKRDEIISNTNLSLAEKEDALQKLNEQNLSGEERLKKEVERTSKNLSKERDDYKGKLEATVSKFHQSLIDSNTYSSLPTANLWDAEQTMTLMKIAGKPIVKELEGREVVVYRAIVDGAEKELSAKEYSEIYLADPKHANQLKNNLIPGGATSSLGGRSDGSGRVAYSRKEMAGNEKMALEYRTKMRNDENVYLVD